jgi:hypothetical protein
VQLQLLIAQGHEIVKSIRIVDFSICVLYAYINSSVSQCLRLVWVLQFVISKQKATLNLFYDVRFNMFICVIFVLHSLRDALVTSAFPWTQLLTVS